MTDDAAPEPLPPPSGEAVPLPAPTDEDGPTGPAERRWGRSGGLPSWKVLAGGAGAVVVAAGALAVIAGGGGGGGACTDDLFDHLRRGDELGTLLLATDLEAARDRGYDDLGDLEELGRTQRETGTYPGLLTNQLRLRQLFSTEEFTARTGVEPDDVECSLGTLDFEVSKGSFDPGEIAGSAEGDDGVLEATDDRLAMAGGPVDDPATLLQPVDDSLADDEDITDALDALDDRDAYSYALQLPDGDVDDGAPRLAASGVAEGDDDQRLNVVVWVFEDEDAATSGRTAMADHLQEEYSEVASFAADGLEVDGRVVVGAFPMRVADRWLVQLTERSAPILPRGDE